MDLTGCGVTSRGYILPFFSGGDIFNLNLKNNGTMRGEPWPLFLVKIGFGIQIETQTTINSSFKDGHCANIIFNKNIVGIIGQIDSTIIDNYKIRVPVVGFEISLSNSILKFI